MQEQALPDIGTFNFEVFSAGRHGRQRASRFELQCDAIAIHEHEILLLSVVGAEVPIPSWLRRKTPWPIDARRKIEKAR